MVKRIWKFPIETNEHYVDLPAGAKILFTAAQADQACLWVEVDPSASPKQRLIRVFGTGHPMPADPGSYVGSVMLHGGALVFHVYDAGYVA